MSTPSRLNGVIAPVLTPFHSDLSVDSDRFVAHARWLLDEGCTALAPFGTTGEATSLSLSERLTLFDALLKGGIDPARLLVGTGLCSIPETVELTKRAVEAQCAGVMMLPPFYYKTINDDGLFAWFSEVIDRVADDRLQIYLYHIPPQAVVGFTVDLVGRLLDAFPKQVVGLKDSSNVWSNTKQLIESFPQLTTFSGSEVFLLKNLRAGGAGCITASGNVNARRLRHLLDNWQTQEADALQEQINAVRECLQQQPMIPMLKAVLAGHLDDSAWLPVRPPLLPVESDDAQTVIRKLQDELGWTV